LIRFLPAAAALAAAAFLMTTGGCGDDAVGPEASSILAVRVVDRDDGGPRAGVKAMLLDPAANLPAAPVAVTDSSGAVLWRDVPTGVYALLVIPGPNRELFSVPATVSPGSADIAPSPYVVLTMPARRQTGGSSIAGAVFDAVTGQPLDSAIVGSRDDWLGAYPGWSPEKADITDSTGAFTVRGIAFTRSPLSDLLLQVEPLIVQRAGYRPLEWFADSRRISGTDITGVELELEPIADPQAAGVDTARGIEGVVTYRGEPVGGLLVGLSYWGDFEPPPGFDSGSDAPPAEVSGPADPRSPAVTGAGAGAPGRTAVTDDEGRYAFSDLKTGWYLVHAAYPVGDGFMMAQPLGPGYPANGINPLPVKVIDEGIAAADTVPVFRAIRVLEPAPGATGVSNLPTVRWTSVPGAATYDLALDQLVIADISDTTVAVPADFPLSGGVWTVSIAAYDADGIPVGAVETASRFLVSNVP